MYHGKDCVEKFIELKWLYATFLQQTMTELTDVLKKEHEAAEKYCHICLKEFANDEPRGESIPENMQILRKVRDHFHYVVYIEEQPITTETKKPNTRLYPRCVS